MTSDIGKTLIERLYNEAWNQQKIAVLDEIFAEDITLHVGDDTVTGRDTIKGFIQDFMRCFPDIHYRIDEITANGNTAAVRWYGKATHKEPYLDIPAQGKTMEQYGSNFIHVENDQIKHIYLFTDMAALLETIK